MKMSGQIHASAALSPEKGPARFPLHNRLSWTYPGLDALVKRNRRPLVSQKSDNFQSCITEAGSFCWPAPIELKDSTFVTVSLRGMNDINALPIYCSLYRWLTLVRSIFICGSLVTMAWRVLNLQIEMATRYGYQLRICWRSRQGMIRKLDTGLCPDIGTSSIDWAQLSRFYLKTETESILRKVVFWKNKQDGF
jgi:hypothetical protein